MGKFEEKRLLILGMVGSLMMFSLLTFPALAGPPIPDAVCQTRALDIRDRAVIQAAEADSSTLFSNTCPNLCKGGQDEAVTTTIFFRSPGGVQDVAVAVTIEYPGSDLAYGASTYGPLAFICDAVLQDPNDITSDVISSSGVVYGVGYPGPPGPPCGVIQTLCGPVP